MEPEYPRHAAWRGLVFFLVDLANVHVDTVLCGQPDRGLQRVRRAPAVVRVGHRAERQRGVFPAEGCAVVHPRESTPRTPFLRSPAAVPCAVSATE